VKPKNTPNKTPAPKPERVKIVNADGVIAQPYEHEIAAWLKKGWTRAK
tara:strand:+ start:251 stop:394 length:144 start_codon:yes stop_codon:yes gene_type:complete